VKFTLTLSQVNVNVVYGDIVQEWLNEYIIVERQISDENNLFWHTIHENKYLDEFIQHQIIV
jgi:hypothetical protein